MISFFEFFGLICGVFCTCIFLYHVWICAGIFYKKRQPIPDCTDKCHIAVIIPARNEEKVIASLISSLNNQRYPKELYDIYVIPNGCTDKTEQIARESGAKILECKEPVHSKGDVLHQAFNRLLERCKYDVFCIFDADNLVDGNFLHIVNNTYFAGYECAQGYRKSKNSTETWISGSMTVFYQFMGVFFNESRWRRKMSAHLNGTGIMISTKLIRDYGWNTETLTEDLEFTAKCALNNCPIAWMPDAVVYDEQPTRFGDSAVQRRRWTAGSMQCTRRLTRKLLRKRTPSAFDAAMLFIGNLMNYLSIAAIPMFILNPRLRMLAEKLGGVRIACLLLAYLLIYWSVLMLAAHGMLRHCDIKENTGSTVLLFPLFMASWMVINIYSAFTRVPQWKPIVHDSDKVPPEMYPDGQETEDTGKRNT